MSGREARAYIALNRAKVSMMEIGGFNLGVLSTN